MGVLGAERLGAEADEATAHAVGEAIVAAPRVMDRAGFSESRSHWWLPFDLKRSGVRPPGICIDDKTKELLDKGFVS